MPTTDPRKAAPGSRGGAQRRRRTVITYIAAGAILASGAVVALFQLGGPTVLPGTCEVRAQGGATIPLTTEQAHIASVIGAVSLERRLPARAAVIATATAMQESKLRNLDHGDRDSLGVFQQRPSQGWGTPAQLQDPVYATREFYDHLVKVKGYLDRPLTEVAQDVQKSGFPDAYAKHEEDAQVIAGAFTGDAPFTATCRLDPPSGTTSAGQIAAEINDLFGTRARGADGAVTVNTSSARGAAAIASWGVANAARHGITSVSSNGHTWTRASDASTLRWVQDPAAPGARSTTLRTG